MIDKVDVRIPEFTEFGPVLGYAVEDVKRNKPNPHFRPSRYYQYVADLREEFDLDAVIHLSSRFGRKNHKVEIVDVGEKTLTDVAEIICRLFAVDPWSLKVMRVDLAADIEGIPVPWFAKHAYVNRKRYSSRIEKSSETEVEFVSINNAGAQTLYAGKRPNLFRIYDKLAELKLQLSRIERKNRRFNKGMIGLDMTEEQRYFGQLIAPAFGEFCADRGYRIGPDSIVTRIERQIGTRIPPEFETLGDLRYAHEINPFESLRILSGSQDIWFTKPLDGVPLRDHLATMGLQTLTDHYGSAQEAKQFVYRHANGNGKRLLSTLEASRPKSPPLVTSEQILEAYRVSTLAQTSAKAETALYLTPKYERTRQTT